MLEVGAATGLLTRPLLERAGHVTAMEPSAGMLRRLLATRRRRGRDASRVIQGMVEDLPARGRLRCRGSDLHAAPRRRADAAAARARDAVLDRVVMLLETEDTLDWAYLARAAAAQGFDVRLHIVTSAAHAGRAHASAPRSWSPTSANWEPADPGRASVGGVDAREIEVPYPRPAGLRDAARPLLPRRRRPGGPGADGPRGRRAPVRQPSHRRAPSRRDEIDGAPHGDAIQLVRLPKAGEVSEQA